MTDWIPYAVAVSLLLGAAAWGAEAALRAFGRPARGVWLAALAGSLLLPLYAAAGGPLPSLLPFPAPFAGSAGMIASRALVPGAGAAAAVTPSVVPTGGAAWLALAWAAASLALACLILVLELRLRRERRGWLESAVAGVPVLVSRDVGPAVAGLLRGRIVLPAWALRLDARVVRAIVAHEAEHVRARDTRVLLAGLAAVCALPWNPVLWWQYRRLGLAVELDCDARVLRALPDPRAYGLALLETARRRSRGALLHAALLRPRSFLQRRIEMMDLATGRRLTAHALASVSIAAMALVAAVCAESPAEPGAVEAVDAVRSEVTVVEADSLAYYPEQRHVIAFSPTVTVYVEETAPAKRVFDLFVGPRILEQVEQLEENSLAVIEKGDMRYVAEPEPHWVLSAGRVRFITSVDRPLTVEGDSITIRSLRANPIPTRIREIPRD